LRRRSAAARWGKRTAPLHPRAPKPTRDIADIESAAAALRRAEPALESWTNPPAHANPKPRPVWLLIAVLWFSTAVVTLGAVAAIAALVG
jgi:hypothetical protein